MKSYAKFASAALCFLGAMLLAASLLAQPAHEIKVPVCTNAPQLDAQLTDPCWKEAVKLTGFNLTTTGQPAAVQTTAWMCRDDTWLYIAFRCDEPNPISIKRTATLRDGDAYQDDSVEIFLDPGFGGKEYAHLALSVGNVQQDQWCRGRERLASWHLPWRSAAQADPHVDTSQGWSAELAIPLVSLRQTGGKGEWRINLCRNRRTVSPAEHTSLAPLPAGSGFHSPQHFLTVKGLTGFPVQAPFGPMLRQIKVSPLTVKGNVYSYGLEVAVKNYTGQAGEVELVTQDLPRTGQGKQIVEKVELGPSEQKEVALRIEVANAGPREAWVGLREPGSDFWLQKATVPGMEGLARLDAYLDRNYYTTEKEARVYAEMAIGKAERAREGLVLQAELMGAKGKAISRGSASCAEDLVSIPLDLKNIQAGRHIVKVLLMNKAKAQLGAVDLPLIKHPPAPQGTNELKIDRYNRCLLLNGKPFFPVGAVGTYYHGRFEGWRVEYFEAQFRYCQQAGLNTVLDWVGYHGTPESLEDSRKTYDLAQKYGLKVVGKPYGGNRDLYYSSPKFREAATQTINAMDLYLNMSREHPAVIGYYHFDEPQPGLKIDDILENFTRKVHSIDPYHPVYMSLTRYIHESQRRFFGTVTDLLGAHNYWYVQRPGGLQAMSGYWDMLDIYSQQAHNPTMALPQLDYWGLGYGGGGFMLPEEQRAQTYLALARGARSVVYFVLPFRHEASVAAQKQISAEVQELAPALLTREPEQELTFEPESAAVVFPMGNIGIRGQGDRKYPLVQVSLRNHPEGGQVLLAVNPGKQAVKVRFRVSSLTSRSTVRNLIGDKQKYAVTDDSFSDTIEAMGTRAYMLTGTQMPKDEPVRIHLAMSGPGVEEAAKGVQEAEKPEGKPKKNLVINSSFEETRMPSHPVRWEARAWTYLIPDAKAHGLETNDPYHGKYCFRITRVVPDECRALHEPIPLPKDGTYTMSMYLRADKPGTKAMLYLKAPYDTVTLDTTWKRYTMTREFTQKDRPFVGVYHVGAVDSGNIYVDAVQLEEGREATEYEAN